MTWKRTELAKLESASTIDGLRKTRHPNRYGKDAALAGWLRRFGVDEKAIAALVAAREAAWNSGDVAAYRELLTEDADIVSATGRAARGRDALLKLYAEQHAGALAGAVTHTKVTHVRMLSDDVALADVEYRMTGGRASSVGAIRRGLMAFVLRRENGRWRIAAIRSIPALPGKKPKASKASKKAVRK
ncbi:MAG: SgcJ/EcaC family oxidoreductase [Proteobacteria bacterium]|nr:SgcJ/EcaC family oxidoreductase [Pseudomonadota bacterium]